MRNLTRQTILAAALALTGLQVQAADYTYAGQLDDGPLAGQAFAGEFSYDAGLLTGAGSEYLDLNSWTLNVLGMNFGSDTVVAMPQAAFWDGQFVGLSATFVSGAYEINLGDGVVDFSGAYLSYKTPVGEGFGSYTVSSVPEPASWMLGLTGLVAVGLAGSRRRRDVVSATTSAA